MLNVLLRLRNKKGFTLIEIIIAVAIIGLMSAIAVPSFINSNRRAEITRSSDYAEGFYFALQQAITPYVSKDGTSADLKITMADGSSVKSRSEIEKDPTYSAADYNYFVYAITENGGQIMYFEIGLYNKADYLTATTTDFALRQGSDSELLITTNTTTPLVPGNADLAGNLVTTLGEQMKTSGDDGFYYAMFDLKFRVTMAYYSKFADRTLVLDSNGDLTGAPCFFKRDGTICTAGGNDSFTFGAFPNEYRFVQSADYPNPTRQWYDAMPNL